MYHLTIFFTILLTATAKIINFKDINDDIGISGDSDISFDNHKRVGLVDGRPLWVLSLRDDWTTQQLRLGTEEENIEFNHYASPLIKKRTKKDDPSNPKLMAQTSEDQAQERNENINLRKEIVKTINKFALSTSVEPDSYLSESWDNSDPSIELHFKGDYTALVVNCENKMWRYFINPPSPLPEWFYTVHDTNSGPVRVPDNVKNEFYKSILRLLRLLLSYPL